MIGKLSISSKNIRENGGRGLLLKYSMNHSKKLSFPNDVNPSEDIKTKKNSYFSFLDIGKIKRMFFNFFMILN